jgi:phospholipid transport system substrate-binding protein
MNTPRAVAVTLMLLVVSATPAVAGGPTEALSHYVDRAFVLLDDPALKGVHRASARQAALGTLTEEALDFPEAARRSLGAHWHARTAEERAHFVHVFTALVVRGSLARFSYDGERIVYDREILHGATAQVHARLIARRGRVTPVVFSLNQDANARWRIADVAFNDMSLVGMFRVQFDRMIRTSSYDDMMRLLEARTQPDVANTSGRSVPASTAP